jgi:signal transduction histidine kinase/CHASE2 domain-containing sensor protein
MKASPNRQSLRRLEWGVLVAALLGLVLWLSGPGDMPRVNHMVQDTVSWLYPRPASPDVVIVAIDDRSISAIGRWPWRRALHAEMVSKISSQGPRAIGLDILLSEEDLDYPGDDLLLMQAISASGRVVLPIVRRDRGNRMGVEKPLPMFASAAAQLGHVHVHTDSESVVRSIFLQEGPPDGTWPHMSIALQCAAGLARAECQQKTSPKTSSTWLRQHPQIITFADGETPFATYSYIDVLRGHAPADAFRNKYVLIGATAAGLGNSLAAPDGLSARRMPNVELVAHTLSSGLRDMHIQPASQWANSLFNIAPVIAALLAVAMLGPSAALMSCAALFGLTLVATGLAPLVGNMQFAPAAALLGIALAYPLWSWRRLNAAAHFLGVEMQGLQRLSIPLAHQQEDSGPKDFLDRRIQAVEHASRQLRDLHHFVSASLQQLPSPTFVCDTKGTVLLANTAAERYVGEAPELIKGAYLPNLLQSLVDSETGQPLITPQKLQTGGFPAQAEGTDKGNRSVLLLAKPFTATQGGGWLMTLVDLTEMRQAQDQRDQAMHFISHDIRAPIASIITLLEMQREYPGEMTSQELLARVERYAQASLELAESFVYLASAKFHAYHYASVDLSMLLEETVDDAWAAAREQQIRVTLTPSEETAFCIGDRALLRRAITNVLGNAIKYSPKNTMIECGVTVRTSHSVISIRDQGPGIPRDKQTQLFEPFQRLHNTSHPSIDGAGLGLALVHTVIERHGGVIELESEEGQGAEFRLVLPRGRGEVGDTQPT